MALTVHQFPCLSDNYGFLARDEESGLAACIDTPEAGAILRELDKLGWTLALILNTHWHADHCRASFVEIETDKGHDAFLLDEPQLDAALRGFFASTAHARGLT